jgi:DNA-binding GntR family transcriptional regulator
MARYREIAADLRTRIQRGEFPVGSKLPGISALQEEYDVPGLNTIRGAQQLLVEEGMLETRQGIGVFVTSVESPRQVDVDGELALDALTKAVEHLAQAIERLADVAATAASH